METGTCRTYSHSREVGRAPAVVEPRYRSRHVSGVCCRDKSGMPESRALLLCALLGSGLRMGTKSAGIFHRSFTRFFDRYASFIIIIVYQNFYFYY